MMVEPGGERPAVPDALNALKIDLRERGSDAADAGRREIAHLFAGYGDIDWATVGPTGRSRIAGAESPTPGIYVGILAQPPLVWRESDLEIISVNVAGIAFAFARALKECPWRANRPAEGCWLRILPRGPLP